MEQSMPTQIPIQSVDADNLPRESGWSYEKITKIVGNLYLESRNRVMLMDEQFQAIMSEYKQRYSQLEEKMVALQAENLKLRKELDKRNEQQRTNSATNTSG